MTKIGNNYRNPPSLHDHPKAHPHETPYVPYKGSSTDTIDVRPTSSVSFVFDSCKNLICPNQPPPPPPKPPSSLSFLPNSQHSIFLYSSLSLTVHQLFMATLVVTLFLSPIPIYGSPISAATRTSTLPSRFRRQASFSASATAAKLIITPNHQSLSMIPPQALTSETNYFDQLQQSTPQAEPSWRCNFTLYPLNGCSPLFTATCDRKTNTCICGDTATAKIIDKDIASVSDDDEHDRSIKIENDEANKNVNLRHRLRFCLSAVELGDRCESSGQCRTAFAACYFSGSIGSEIGGKCACDEGFSQNGKTCIGAPNRNDENVEQCAANGGTWIFALARCVNRSDMPRFANRGVGRAGGGRGGGGGGHGRGGSVGGRSTGSRAWFSSDRNLMRKNASSTLRFDFAYVFLLLQMPLLLLFAFTFPAFRSV